MDCKEVFEKIYDKLPSEKKGLIKKIQEEGKNIANIYKEESKIDYYFENFNDFPEIKNIVKLKELKVFLNTNINLSVIKIDSEISIVFKHDNLRIKATVSHERNPKINLMHDTNIEDKIYSSGFAFSMMDSGFKIYSMSLELQEYAKITKSVYTSIANMSLELQEYAKTTKSVYTSIAKVKGDPKNNLEKLLPIIQLIYSEEYNKDNFEDMCQLYFDTKIDLKEKTPNNIYINNHLNILNYIKNNKAKKTNENKNGY